MEELKTENDPHFEKELLWCQKFISDNFSTLENLDINRLHLLLNKELINEWLKLKEDFEKKDDLNPIESYHVCDTLQKGELNFFFFQVKILFFYFKLLLTR